jgi:hypothetical protein
MSLNFSQQLLVWSILFFISTKIFMEIILRCVKLQLKKKFLEKIKNEDNADYFYSLPFDLNTDKEIAKEVVKRDGHLLCVMNETLRNDKEIVMAALQDYPQSFKYVSEDLKNDKDVILKAIVRDPSIISQINEKFKKDKSLIFEIIEANPNSYCYLDDILQGDDFKNDREFSMNLVKAGMPMYRSKFEDDRNFVLEAVKSNGDILKDTWSFFMDKEILTVAVLNSRHSFRHVCEEMRLDKELFWYSRGYFKRIAEIKIFDLRFEFN